MVLLSIATSESISYRIIGRKTMTKVSTLSRGVAMIPFQNYYYPPIENHRWLRRSSCETSQRQAPETVALFETGGPTTRVVYDPNREATVIIGIRMLGEQREMLNTAKKMPGGPRFKHPLGVLHLADT